MLGRHRWVAQATVGWRVLGCIHHLPPQVPVRQVWVVVSRVGAVDGLFAVNLNYAAILNVPRVLQLIEDITGLIFNQQSCAGRPEHGHGEPLGEHVHDEGPQSVQAGQLVGQVYPASLLPKLEEQDPWRPQLGLAGGTGQRQALAKPVHPVEANGDIGVCHGLQIFS